LNQIKSKTEKDLAETKASDQAKIDNIVKDAKINLEKKINEGKIALE
jgi:F0F1-type ATP synthase membrane subunit b/b'